jgi:CDP-diacylglycerol--glycerol-3-phosphate 3-phosphatidyltransferase
MVSMITSALKPAVTRLINPVARLALRTGLTPNMVTVLGTCGVATASLFFYPRENFFIGTLVIVVFALSDLFDGAMARISQTGASRWGAFLDSTLDRISDSVILIGVAIALIEKRNSLSYLVLLCLLTGALIPYIRAKAESFDLDCSVGIAERTERLIIILVAVGFHGLGVPYILAGGIWLLAIAGVITVLQRATVIYRGLQ